MMLYPFVDPQKFKARSVTLNMIPTSKFLQSRERDSTTFKSYNTEAMLSPALEPKSFDVGSLTLNVYARVSTISSGKSTYCPAYMHVHVACHRHFLELVLVM